MLWGTVLVLDLRTGETREMFDDTAVHYNFGTSLYHINRDEIDAYNWEQFFQFRRMLQQHYDEKMLWRCVQVKHKYIPLLTQSILCRWDR